LPVEVLKQFDDSIKDVNLKDVITGKVTQIKKVKEGFDLLIKPSEAVILSF